MSNNYLLQVLRAPARVVKHFGGKGFFKWIPDKTYLKICYFGAFGKKLNLDNPKEFNEKLQWLKLNDRKPLYTKMVDKYSVKEYVAEVIGEKYIIPSLGIWDSFDKINFDSLPEQFVLKCTHDSGGLVICKDKKKLDIDEARKKINKSLQRDFYYVGREWPYKDVKPRIIAEKYLAEADKTELVDYKLMCFNGRVQATFVCEGRNSKAGLRITIYDRNWKRMPVEREHPSSENDMPIPNSYNEMVKLAEQLSFNISFARVDFYEINGQPLFGEITFFPGNGFLVFKPDEYDSYFGNMLDLPKGR